MSLTPMFQQYFEIKENYKDCILFYRLGDFYEMFYEDAQVVSRALDLTLTSRASAPMCGVPYHTAETYLAKLINAGFKVAICEQITEPGQGKMVQREVVRVITPGTVTEESILEENRNNYIMSILVNDGVVSLCYCDITTGEFKTQTIKSNLVVSFTDAISRVMPKEVIGNLAAKEFYNNLPILRLGTLPKFTQYFDWAFNNQRADKNLSAQFGENYKKVFGLDKDENMIAVCGGLVEYLNETQKRFMKNINKIQIVNNDEFLKIDPNSRRNLELTETIQERKKYGSLLWLLDKTKTSMGARKLRKIFDEPLRNSKKINERLNSVEELVKKIVVRDRLCESLSGIHDIERLTGKIAYGSVNPKDLLSLKSSLQQLPTLKDILLSTSNLKGYAQKIGDFSAITDLLEKSIKEDAPYVLKDGGVIKTGFNQELDSLRRIRDDATDWKNELEQVEKEKTGISNLKIGYNRVFGFYIEVNKKDSDKVPLYYERKQTVSNNERYITEDLKKMEEKVLGANDNAIKLEIKIFNAIKETLLNYVESFQTCAEAIAEVDAILSLAVVAVKNNFVKPVINGNINHIKIEDGRHPVVEAFLKNANFISNDTFLDNKDDRIMILTGPNMAGKSTYMRQVALITFMAHIGSFVPAKSAEIAITDRIFTRVGASDDLAFGQSTFMVEMSEVATILAGATDESLIILDEIGRGTSTFDGLSIAWAVVEHISKNLKAKTLFATHYHELTDLEGVLDGVKNYKIAVKELEDGVVFLHKILRGGANKSFGIEVARLAGVPKDVLKRAKEISGKLEQLNNKLDTDIFKEDKTKAEDNSKLAISLLNVIKDIDINRVSPMGAFDILLDLVKRAKGE